MERMRHASFRQLQVFEAIARLGSFTAAAEQLHLTQPTVSAQMKRLAEIVGLPLFEQVGRQVYLTAAGKTLLEAVREIFDTANRFELNIANQTGLRTGTLRIAGVTTAEYFAPDYLGMFRNRYPGINLKLMVANRAGVLKRIDENQDDLYFLNHLPDDVAVEAVSFLDDTLVVIAPPDHPLSKKRNITLEQLSEEHILTREEEAGTRRSLTSRLRSRGIELKPSMELGSNEAIKRGIMGGLGIGVIARIACRSEVESGELVVLDVEGFPIDNPWYVIYPKGKQLTVVADAFVRFIQSLELSGARN